MTLLHAKQTNNNISQEAALHIIQLCMKTLLTHRNINTCYKNPKGIDIIEQGLYNNKGFIMLSAKLDEYMSISAPKANIEILHNIATL